MNAPEKTVRTPLTVIGPLPPPFHGVAVSTSLIVSSPTLNEAFAVRHLDTSDRRAVDTIGRWDVQNVGLGLRHALRLAQMLAAGRRGVVYLPLSQNSGGFLRDSLLIWVAAAARCRVAGHLRGSEFRSAFYGTRGRIMRWWVRTTLARLTSVAVLAPSLRSVFDSLLPAERVAVVPNGTPAMPAPNGTRDPNRVLFFSNLRRRKGLVEAVDAALTVVRDHPQARFLFVGETEEPALLDELHERVAPAAGRIEFRESIAGDEKPHLLAAAGILLFPPNEPEGHPRVVLEAMSAGMAIVTTAQGAIPETVRDGIDGFVLPSSDPALLAASVSRLLDDHDLQARMGAAARLRYETTYTIEATDRRLADWLRDVAYGRTDFDG
jgi:glycosyltransferase involved in cell wall biosynthesis